jgi:phospholipase C
MRGRNRFVAAAGTLAMVLGAALGVGAAPPTETPIKHVIVIFQENVSFDHYFGTYPNAANNDPSEPQFTAAPGTPAVNGLTGALLTNNPNGVNPFRSRARRPPRVTRITTTPTNRPPLISA